MQNMRNVYLWLVFVLFLSVFSSYEFDNMMLRGPYTNIHMVAAVLFLAFAFFGLFKAYMAWKSGHPTPARPRMEIID